MLVFRYPFTPNQEVPLPDWQTYLKRTASEILYQQTPEKLLSVRERLYELIIHGIPSEEIFKVFFFLCYTYIVTLVHKEKKWGYALLNSLL